MPAISPAGTFFAPLERRKVENRLVSVTASGQTTTFTYPSASSGQATTLALSANSRGLRVRVEGTACA